MESKQVQLYLDREKMIEASPVTSAECVMLTDGNNLQKVLDNDLTTPTVVHEESSFKTGVGDIDVSSSVVDGEVGRMVIKGKTYQNILPEPSTHVLTNNKEMFKVNEGLDPNVEIVDGVSKSAILKGNTKLVDKFGYELDTIDNVSIITTKGYMLNVSTGEQTEIAAHKVTDFIYLKDSITKITFDGGVTQRICFYNYDKTFISGDSTSGTNTKTFNVPEGAKYFRISYNFSTELTTINDQNGTKVYDYNNDLQLVSVKMPVLTTTGKNLFDGEIEEGIIDGNTGEPQTYNGRSRSKNFIRVPKNTDLYIKVENGSSTSWTTIYGYDENKKYLGSIINSPGANKTFNTGDASYIKWKNNAPMDTLGNIQIEEGSTATTYEPHKTNILSTSEDVTLRGIGDVKDELDCLTGEVTERIGEIVLDGSEDWILGSGFSSNENGNFECKNINLGNRYKKVVSTHFNYDSGTDDRERVRATNSNNIVIYINKTRLESPTVDGFKNWLITQKNSGNPVKVQYQLLEKSIKTVDLSTSGNWEKVVLNGSEDWGVDGSYCFCRNLQINSACAFTDSIPVLPTKTNSLPSHASFSGARYFTVLIGGILNDPVKLKQYLSQNPMTVWYQTTTHQDSTQVKQPIFFKEGHIIQSSGVDNSLIPTLDYQAKTSNSYVMDLMKPNTRYTMKAKSASGTFTIDGTSYGAGTNGTFTTPSSMTNKLLVMSNKTNEEVMILEGDVVSKTIPYFKGIRSAFEGESKIEVLSSNCANLFHPKDIVNDNYWELDVTGRAKIFLSAPRRNAVNMVQRDSNGIELMARVNEVEDQIEILPNAKTLRLVGGCFRPTDAWYELITQNLIVADAKSENNTKEIDYKSNSTKIPLLSPLRSLPNGVCDELIIDRMKKKATLVQRVGKVVLNGSENWSQSQIRDKHYVVMLGRCSEVGIPEKYPSTLLCSHFINQQPYAYDREGINIHVNYNFHIGFLKNRLSGVSVDSCKKWLSQNPVTVYYELASPVVTEIDLESFPLVYKDGHIFLNSEIAPVVEIAYNINQSQQIQSNNETLQRHELDILDLDNLIVSFVNAEYNLRLLKFNMELSMMALAE